MDYKVLNKIIELKIISLIIFIIVGMLAGYLLAKSKDNIGALIGGYVCLGIFGFMALFLIVYNVTKENFENILNNERKSQKNIVAGYKDLAKTSRTTATELETARRQNITTAPSSSVYQNYQAQDDSTTGDH